jgi:hypothetical protein
VSSGDRSLDENLAKLVKRHEGYRDLVLRIAKADPEKVRSMLPRAAQAGALEVGFINRPDYCTSSQRRATMVLKYNYSS